MLASRIKWRVCCPRDPFAEDIGPSVSGPEGEGCNKSVGVPEGVDGASPAVEEGEVDGRLNKERGCGVRHGDSSFGPALIIAGVECGAVAPDVGFDMQPESSL